MEIVIRRPSDQATMGLTLNRFVAAVEAGETINSGAHFGELLAEGGLPYVELRSPAKGQITFLANDGLVEAGVVLAKIQTAPYIKLDRDDLVHDTFFELIGLLRTRRGQLSADDQKSRRDLAWMTGLGPGLSAVLSYILILRNGPWSPIPFAWLLSGFGLWKSLKRRLGMRERVRDYPTETEEAQALRAAVWAED